MAAKPKDLKYSKYAKGTHSCWMFPAQDGQYIIDQGPVLQDSVFTAVVYRVQGEEDGYPLVECIRSKTPKAYRAQWLPDSSAKREPDRVSVGPRPPAQAPAEGEARPMQVNMTYWTEVWFMPSDSIRARHILHQDDSYLLSSLPICHPEDGVWRAAAYKVFRSPGKGSCLVEGWDLATPKGYILEWTHASASRRAPDRLAPLPAPTRV